MSEEPKRVWIVSKKKDQGGLISYAVKSTECKAVDCLEALRRHLIDVDQIHPGDIHFSSDGDQSWVLSYPTGSGPIFHYQAEWFVIDEPSAFGEKAGEDEQAPIESETQAEKVIKAMQELSGPFYDAEMKRIESDIEDETLEHQDDQETEEPTWVWVIFRSVFQVGRSRPSPEVIVAVVATEEEAKGALLAERDVWIEEGEIPPGNVYVDNDGDGRWSLRTRPDTGSELPFVPTIYTTGKFELGYLGELGEAFPGATP